MSTTYNVASFLQIRGSIPLSWSHKPNMQWNPPVIVNEDFDLSFSAAKTHIQETNAVYGRQYLINLIDKKRS
jgi:hypothetical protein